MILDYTFFKPYKICNDFSLYVRVCVCVCEIQNLISLDSLFFEEPILKNPLKNLRLCLVNVFYLYFQKHIFKVMFCGGQSINRPIKVKIVGPTAHPRMQIRPRRPKSGRKGNHRGGVVNITKIEFRIRPRTPYPRQYASEDDQDAVLLQSDLRTMSPLKRG